MKILHLLKKYRFIFLISFLIIFGFVLYLLTPVTPPQPHQPAPSPTISQISIAPLQTGFAPANQIIWKLPPLNFPAQLPLLQFGPPDTRPETYSLLAKNLGVTTPAQKIANQPLIIFTQPDSDISFYINLKDKVAQFSTDLNRQSLPSSGKQTSPSTLSANLESLLNSSLSLPQNLNLKPADAVYQTLNSEWFVSSPKNQATVIQINLNYAFSDYPITFRGLPSITARYSIYGPLISLRFSLPPLITEGSNQTLLDLTTIQQTPFNQFEIVSVSGNQSFDLAGQEETIKTITITNGYLGYIINPKSAVAPPYFFFTGTGQTAKYGAVNVTIATPATKP